MLSFDACAGCKMPNGSLHVKGCLGCSTCLVCCISFNVNVSDRLYDVLTFVVKLNPRQQIGCKCFAYVALAEREVKFLYTFGGLFQRDISFQTAVMLLVCDGKLVELQLAWS